MSKFRTINYLIAGTTIVICTPIRFVQHLKETEFISKYITTFVLDEADKLMEKYEQDLREIIKLVPQSE